MKTAIRCRECDAVFFGSRAEARQAFWEPYSNRSQWHWDHGPMVCPACVTAAIDAVIDALRWASR